MWNTMKNNSHLGHGQMEGFGRKAEGSEYFIYKQRLFEGLMSI